MIDAADVAQQLVAAERERKSIGQFSDAHPDFDLATAYQAQRLFIDAKLEAGERFVGWKLGLTSKNKQHKSDPQTRTYQPPQQFPFPEQHP